MSFADIMINSGSIFALLLLAIRARIAYDQRKWGRTAFCISFGIFVMRTLALRWLTGITKSGGVGPDPQFAAILSGSEVTILIVILIVGGLAWVTIEEYWEFREQRRLKKLAKLQESAIKAKDREIDRLNQKANLKDAAPENPKRHPNNHLNRGGLA
jgi:hypothetical protein